jgi:hypothetical protein
MTTELFTQCRTCSGTGYTKRMLPEECSNCTRGFVPVHPHIVIVVEDGFAKLQAITPAGADVTVDIIDLDDDGYLEEESLEEAMKRLLTQHFPDWKHAEWGLEYHSIYGWQLDWLVIDANSIDITDEYLGGEQFAASVVDDVSLEALNRNDITEVKRDE